MDKLESWNDLFRISDHQMYWAQFPSLFYSFSFTILTPFPSQFQHLFLHYSNSFSFTTSLLSLHYSNSFSFTSSLLSLHYFETFPFTTSLLFLHYSNSSSFTILTLHHWMPGHFLCSLQEKFKHASYLTSLEKALSSFLCLSFSILATFFYHCFLCLPIVFFDHWCICSVFSFINVFCIGCFRQSMFYIHSFIDHCFIQSVFPFIIFSYFDCCLRALLVVVTFSILSLSFKYFS